MSTLQHSRVSVNPVDTLDLLDQAYQFGHEDATEQRNQQGSAFFPMATPAWHAYNQGYADGCAQLAILTGIQQPYWLPQAVIWNSGPVAGLYRCQHCGCEYDPTFSRSCPRCGK